MSCKKHLNNKLKENELKTSKSHFFISAKRLLQIIEAWMTFLILPNYYFFYITPPCSEQFG